MIRTSERGFVVATPHAEKVLLGEAGEHLVMSRLLRHGHLASQAPRTWKADDILIHGGCSVQVKTTNKGLKPEWLVGKSIEVSPVQFYALVDYRDALNPVVYVVPSGDLEVAAETADRRYYEQRPNSKPFDGRTVRDGWSHDVPEYPDGWLQRYLEAWSLVQEDEPQQVRTLPEDSVEEVS